MILRSISIEDFKAIHQCALELTPTTTIVGANNSGKSSVLQAIHMAARAMYQAREANKQSTLSLGDAEYVPSEDYSELGHRTVWGNRDGTPQSKVTFEFEDPADGKLLNASVVLKSARNEGIFVSPSIDQKLISTFRQKGTTFSAYIPGIAGIPLSENLMSTRHVYRKAASGDSNIVLRNILLKIARLNSLDKLLSYVRDVYPDVTLVPKFDDEADFSISVTATFGDQKGVTKPIEFCGAGFIHVLQIFAYLVLFQPKILLIDEPESHLHPSLQTRLVKSLQRRVSENGSAALITTHSPFIARGLSLGSRTIWLSQGNVVATTVGGEIRKALGWGALDKSILFCTEDALLGPLSRLVVQVETLADKVAPFPFDGVSKLGSGAAIKGLSDALGSHHKVVVHRDRDCMTQAELQPWIEGYDKYGVTTWVTAGSDIEMYFCQAPYVSSALAISEKDAEQLIDDTIAANEDAFKKTFFNKRAEINRRIYADKGGSPSSDDLWMSMPVSERIKGKDLLSKLRTEARAKGFDEKALGREVHGFILAPELMKMLDALL